METTNSKEIKIKKKNDLYNNFNINTRNLILELKCHKDEVKCLTVLKDGRLTSCSYNIIIIHKKRTYIPYLKIKDHKTTVNYITQLSSGILASCSTDVTIKLFKIKENNYEILQTLNYHWRKVLKIIELKNENLASCSPDRSIIFYSKDNNNKYKQDYKINTNIECYTLIQTKENEICYPISSIYPFYFNIYFYDFNEKKIFHQFLMLIISVNLQLLI